MNDKKCKICRRAGEKLFLKGDKCFTPKCVLEKKAYPPGKRDSERKHRSTMTEYGLQLREKQKVRNVYRLSEKQFSNYVKKVTGAKGINPSEKLFEALETRLDNVIYRAGIAKTRSLARQLVSHGHITLNGRRAMIPSRSVNIGDIIKVRKESMEKKPFVGLLEKGNKAPIPVWITFDPKSVEVTVRTMPKLDKGTSEYNLTSVMEFYSR